MPTYFRYTIPGRHTPQAALSAMGPAGSHGLIVRIDTGANETHVFVAAEAPPAAHQMPPAGVPAGMVVPEAEVLRLP
jgi:hypothetical protein